MRARKTSLKLRAAFLVGAGAASLTVFACSSDPAATPGPPEPFPCDVARVMTRTCWNCHKDPPNRGVPFSLVHFSDTRKTTNLTLSGQEEPIWMAMKENLEAKKMPLSPVTFAPEPLPDDEQKIMLDWLDAGAPEKADDAACPK